MSLVGMWFPARCAVCGVVGASPCPGCAQQLRPAPALGVPEGLDSLHALMSYEGVGRRLVSAVKYRNARVSLESLAPAAAGLLPEDVGRALVTVTWAPTSPSRRRQRGFDQAELSARLVGGVLARPVVETLRREPAPPQTGRSRTERIDGPRFRPVTTVAGPVLLVDDVCTTGATLGAAAAALRSTGVAEIHALVLARTPAPGRRAA